MYYKTFKKKQKKTIRKMKKTLKISKKLKNKTGGNKTGDKPNNFLNEVEEQPLPSRQLSMIMEKEINEPNFKFKDYKLSNEQTEEAFRKEAEHKYEKNKRK